MCSRLQPACVQVIQRVVRSRFPSATILTIAHRLDTVIDYDQLLLMAEGRVAEARPQPIPCHTIPYQPIPYHVRCDAHEHVRSGMCTCVYGVLLTVGLRLHLGGPPRRATRAARLSLLGARRQRAGRRAAACHRCGVSVQGGQ